ncbi:hypothetical protein GGR21_002542 [Dysgonomonas hofstadii]|uniref:Pvc16 N-terminal domain-containing protein n=1 Tax=Dysgonomonas hofstadii TaxID=637886 RepID=A0A840CML5_9BACT|nr:DUF4255 domain-containing protein [Dysgonomonas hofstadii]MBB4036636.1 hypothetical protein [Dysgonomonas hofstadii]
MLHKSLIYITRLLNDYLRLRFKLTNDIAFLTSPKESDNTFPANRIGISMINLERETVTGISFNRKQVDSRQFRQSAPSWQLNIYILFAAIFQGKQYEDGIQILSGVLSFVQKNHMLTLQESGTTLSIEPVNLSFHELSNIWSICGGTYHPSIVCKLRALTVNEQEISDMSVAIGNEELKIDG